MLDLTAPCRNIGPVPVLFTIENQIRYDIVRKIFEGGMGIVYEAEQRGARDFIKRVAIKVIRKNFASQGQFIENFDDPHQEWRRLFSEFYGTFLLVLVPQT